MTEIKNAKIESSRIGNFDNRFWGANIHFDYENSSQGISFKIEMIKELLNVLDLNFWESLPGTYCRIKIKQSSIVEIGNIFEDKWIDMTKEEPIE